MYMHLLHIYGVYKGGTSDLRKKRGITGADLEGIGGPDPWNYQNIHLREQHFKIFGVIRG